LWYIFQIVTQSSCSSPNKSPEKSKNNLFQEPLFGNIEKLNVPNQKTEDFSFGINMLKENNLNKENNKPKCTITETPFVAQKIPNRSTVSTAGSDSDPLSPPEGTKDKPIIVPDETTHQKIKIHPPERENEVRPQKITKQNSENLTCEMTRKKFKKEDGSKKYISFCQLINPVTKVSEYFRLYRDNEIGFDRTIQKSIKESNFDDDCQTDDDLIDRAKEELEEHLLKATKEILNEPCKIYEKVRNAKLNPNIKGKNINTCILKK